MLRYENKDTFLECRFIFSAGCQHQGWCAVLFFFGSSFHAVCRHVFA